MCPSKTTPVRPVQGRPAPSSATVLRLRMVAGLEALDQLQPWSTRRVRIAYLTQARPLAA